MSKTDHHSPNTGLKPVELPLLLKQQARILFGLTGRQLLVLTCGLAVSFSLWQTFSSFQQWSNAVLLGCCCAIPTVLSILFAFVSLHGKPLEEWFFILLVWMLTPERLAQKKQLMRTFVKIRAIQDDLVVLDLGRGHVEYQAIVCVEGKYFDLMSDDEQGIAVEAFQHLLNGLSYPISIHIRTLPYVPVSLKTTSIPQHPSKALRRLHAHYLSFLSQLVFQKQPVRIAYFLTIPADEPEEKDETQRLERAKSQVAHRIYEINRQLTRADLSCRRLRSQELLLFYRESFSMAMSEDVPVEPDVLDNLMRRPELLAPRSISIAASRLEIEGEQTYDYLACLALTHLPRTVTPGWLHHLIQTNEPYLDISIHIQPHITDIVTRQLRRKAVELGGVLLAADRQGERHGNTITRHALQDIEKVRDQLIRKDAHLYSLTLLLLVRGASRTELDARVKCLQLVLRSLDFMASPLRFQHHLGFFSCLYGQNVLPRSSHLLPTQAVASFYPFSSIPTMEEGVLLGKSNDNLVSINPYGKERLNANLAVLGIPGSGKSFFLKVILSRLALSTAISIIDIEGEYARWAQSIGAHQVSLTAESLCINPLELSKHTFHEKITILLGFFALLIGDNGTLTQQEKGLISQSLIATYAACGITSDPVTHNRSAPTMNDFALHLRDQEQTSDLSHRLTSYLHLFPRETQISFEYQHIVYNLHQLPESLRPVATYLVTERLWSMLQRGRWEHEGRVVRHLVVVDEAWFLSKFEYGAILLNDFARRIRKYGGGLWIGTQQIGDLLASAQGQDLLALCEMKILFKQDVSSIDAVHNILHLSHAQTKLLQTARQGEALYITGKDTLAIEILASKQEKDIALTTHQST